MISENIKYYRKRARYSQEQIARKLDVTQGSVSSWETGRNLPDMKTMIELAKILGVTVDDITNDEPRRELDSIRVIRNALPILGSIPCGKLNIADQNPDGYTDLAEGVRADFALRCQGDSMAPTILDGDLVLIHSQPAVETGQIAAVNIDGETTLKRVYVLPDGLHLRADNPHYQPIFVPADSDKEIIIHGLAVGYTRIFD